MSASYRIPHRAPLEIAVEKRFNWLFGSSIPSVGAPLN
jgi:hypothetical protein